MFNPKPRRPRRSSPQASISQPSPTPSAADLPTLWRSLNQKLKNEDFPTFCREVLKLKTPRHYLEWWNLAQAHPRLLIEAHRDSWKSFFWSRAYPLFRAVRRPGSTICLISYSEAQARRNLYWIKQMLETIPELKHLVPIGNAQTWQKTMLHLTNNSSIESKGFVVLTTAMYPTGKGFRGHSSVSQSANVYYYKASRN